MRWILGFAGLLLTLAWAQFNPGPTEYYAQCRTLYDEQVLAGARAACELALVADPEYVPALKLLVRVHLDEGNLEEAGDLLERLKRLAPDDLVTRTLEARYLLAKGRPAEALGLVEFVPGPEAAWVKGRAYEAVGRFADALEAYREAAVLGERRARVDAARLLERMGRPTAALEELGEAEGADLLVLKGRLLWTAGELPAAAQTLERALAELSSADPRYTEALATLARVYYGMGDTRRGGLTLDQLSGRVNLVAELLRAGWLWLLGLVLLVGLHLYGESRIEPISTLEVRTDHAWGVGRVYGALLLAWLLGAAAAVGLGWYLYHNWLAAFTPVQAQVVRPVFFTVVALVAGALGWGALRPAEEGAASPLGRRESWLEGLWVGVLLAALVLGYAWLSSRTAWLGPVPFNPLLPLGALALAALALAEPLLRVRLPAALQARYGAGLAPVFAVLVAGLFLMAPVLLWWVVAAGAMLIYLRMRGLLPVMVGWLVLGVLLLGAGYVPWARAFF
ncbi:tetratricopeptide repeat protein [Deinococcota bacterium DY0809b]